MLGLDTRIHALSSQARLLSRFSMYDVVWAAASPAVAYIIREGGISRVDAVAIYCGVAFLASVATFQIFKIGQPMSRFFAIRDAIEVAKACSISVAVAGFVLFTFTRMEETPRSVPLIHFCVLAAGLIVGRGISRVLHRRRETLKPGGMAESPVENIVIVGMSRLALFYSKLVEEFADGESRIVAVLEEGRRFQHRTMNGYLIAGSPLHASKLFDEYATHGVEIHKIVLAIPPEDLSSAAWTEINRVSQQRHIALEMLPDQWLFVRSHNKKLARLYPGDPPREIAPIPHTWVWKFKRLADVLFAVSALILISPLAIVVALLALIDVGYPVVFWQQRVGRFGRPLRVYKFRTMRAPFDRAGHPVSESERMSPVGQFLRATRLDEIPQLWNILTGEMSVVGPRPLLPVDQPKTFSTRLHVRPGLTGLAQISGGKLLSIEEKDALDEYYVRRASILLELAILARTLWIVFRGDRRNEAIIADALAEKQAYDPAKSEIFHVSATSRETGPASSQGRRLNSPPLAAGGGL
jgi:lipopolysaccharide/colanic/teichoic acid biosynthesis glycosyltransferase